MTSESYFLLQQHWTEGIFFRIVNEGDCVHVHFDEISHGASGMTLNSLKDELHAGRVNQDWGTEREFRKLQKKKKNLPKNMRV